MRQLADEFAREGLHAPQRTTATGRRIGARPLSRGQLYLMLKCRTYLGEVQHKEGVYQGLHQPIIDRDLWDQVQAQLAAHTQEQRRTIRATNPSPLTGKLVDGAGEPLIATHAAKAAADGTKRRYHYYVAHSLHHGAATTGLRLPARELERSVADGLARLFDDPLALIATAQLQVRPDQLARVDQSCRELAARLRQQAGAAGELLAQVRVGEGKVKLAVDAHALSDALDVPLEPDARAQFTAALDASLRRAGGTLRLVQASGVSLRCKPDTALVRLLVLARRWWGELRQGELDISQLATREQCSPSYVTWIVRLAFRSPAVTSAILTGRQRAGVDVAALTVREPVSALWSEQARLIVSGTVGTIR